MFRLLNLTKRELEKDIVKFIKKINQKKKRVEILNLIKSSIIDWNTADIFHDVIVHKEKENLSDIKKMTMFFP